MHFAAVEMFVVFVTTHPLLRAGQDKQTLSCPKDSISLGNKSLVDALWHMGLQAMCQKRRKFGFFLHAFSFQIHFFSMLEDFSGYLRNTAKTSPSSIVC